MTSFNKTLFLRVFGFEVSTVKSEQTRSTDMMHVHVCSTCVYVHVHVCMYHVCACTVCTLYVLSHGTTCALVLHADISTMCLIVEQVGLMSDVSASTTWYIQYIQQCTSTCTYSTYMHVHMCTYIVHAHDIRNTCFHDFGVFSENRVSLFCRRFKIIDIHSKRIANFENRPKNSKKSDKKRNLKSTLFAVYGPLSQNLKRTEETLY